MDTSRYIGNFREILAMLYAGLRKCNQDLYILKLYMELCLTREWDIGLCRKAK